MRFRVSLAVFVVFAAACSGGGEAVTTDGVRGSQITDPAREQFEWFLETATSGRLGADTLLQRFTQDFLEAVGGLALVEGVVQLGLTESEWEVVESDFELFGGTVTLRNTDGQRLQFVIATRSVPPYEITDLRGTPLSPEFPEGLSEETLDNRFQGLGESVAWGVFEVVDGSCVPFYGTAVDVPQPVGAVFHLWVLAALAEAVQSRDATFVERFAVDDALKSSLDGQVGPTAEGTEIPLSVYAELMMSISDNSATDHLISRLGREAVERAMVNSGVARPELNIPLLLTREFFVLKFIAQTQDVDDYLDADQAGRRKYLETELAGVSIRDAATDGPGWDSPTLVNEVEWFASPSDLCRTQEYLAGLAADPLLQQGLTTIFDINPGVPLDEEVWDDFQFEGGSEFGVFSAAWYLVRSDGRAFVVSGSVSDTGSLIDEAAAISLFQAAIELAATS